MVLQNPGFPSNAVGPLAVTGESSPQRELHSLGFRVAKEMPRSTQFLDLSFRFYGLGVSLRGGP